jgi:imidazole glycerol phosphate synthase subunit HisF
MTTDNPRKIPLLLLDQGKVVNTKNFANPRYIGDPLNAIEIFNGLMIDELVIIDLGAAKGRNQINFELLEKMAQNCFAPLSYGGGINKRDNAARIISLGFEKILLNSLFHDNPDCCSEIIDQLGSQAVTLGLDFTKDEKTYSLINHRSMKRYVESIEEQIELINQLKFGEILATSITNQGLSNGLDLDLAQKLRELTNLPLILNGGAASYSDLDSVRDLRLCGAAASTVFLMLDSYENVLINYPIKESQNYRLTYLNDTVEVEEYRKAIESLSNTKDTPTSFNWDSTKSCKRCLITWDVPGSYIADGQQCYYCDLHDRLDNDYPDGTLGKDYLESYVARIKKKGMNKKYDCVIGLSGGTDSSYLAYVLSSMGVRLLGVHFDNTWNSPIATSNIRKVVTGLNIDLVTYVVDNNEYDDLYRSFLLAGVRDVETPTDIGFAATLYKIADTYGIDEIVEGHSFRTEGVSPINWLYMDGKYIESVHAEFGTVPIKSFPNLKLTKFLKYNIIKKFNRTRPLYWVDYNKEAAKEFLIKKFDWEWYGGHHLENRFTAFYHSFYLPYRYGIDYRQVELSGLVRSEQITRTEGINRLQESRKYDPALFDLVANRLGYSSNKFMEILNLPKVEYWEFKTYKNTFKNLAPFFWLMVKLNRVPLTFYLKYCK